MERAYLSGSAGLAPDLPVDSHLPAIVLAEMLIGVERADTAARRAGREAFLTRITSAVPTLHFAEPEARSFARLFAALSTAGRRIGERDLQIAATALAHGHDVLTYNVRDFERVPGLRVLTIDAEGRVVEA